MKENNNSISRTWLERLSTGELIKMADSFGIDIPHGLERIFIIEEILEYSNASSQDEEKEELEINHSCSETAALPKQYNISFIEVIVRDPLWVFVYWEVKSHDREIHEKASDFNGYCLRLISLDEGEADAKPGENSFTVPVGIEDCARYIGLAEHSSNGSSNTMGRYVIKLGVIRGNSELHIVTSQPFCLPKLIENDNIQTMKENPLVRLSAVTNLSIIKSIDRQSRIKKH